mgnify:FL=1|jgi:hypothetical protein|tara:strand:+ start:19395 stop:19826 length:432 start_codon:yes stop_codon:yes gene_type:complete
MSKIKSLLAKETVTTVEFPEIDGFMVDLVYLNRDELMKIRNRSLTFKFNKRTRQREEEVDNDKFLEAYSEKAIKGWSGLKYKNLPLLFPADISGANGEEEIEYSPEEALELLKNSTLFDQFVTDAMNDFEQFSKTKAETDEKN